MTRASLVSLFMAAASLLACEPDPSVSLEASVESAELRVAGSALASEVEGSFELLLALGEYAPEASEVSAGTFAVARAGAELVGGQAFSAGLAFPVRVGPGESRRIPFTIAGEVEPDAASELCSGPIAIVGSVQDSRGGGPTRLSSTGFQAVCTP